MTTGTIEKSEVKRFIETHPLHRVSAARIMYSMYVQPEVEAAAAKLTEVQNEMTEEDLECQKLIAETTDGETLVKLMRKHMNPVNRDRLRIQLLKCEAEVLPWIKEKSMTTRQDDFIENMVYFLLRCKENTTSWILEQYDQFRSEYLKSMLCLVLGVRGEKEMIPFMIEETKRYVQEYPQEYFEQAAILAVQELYVRFFRARQ